MRKISKVDEKISPQKTRFGKKIEILDMKNSVTLIKNTEGSAWTDVITEKGSAMEGVLASFMQTDTN